MNLSRVQKTWSRGRPLTFPGSGFGSNAVSDDLLRSHRRIQQVAGEWAYAVWELNDQSHVLVRMTQAQYNTDPRQVQKPATDAVFLMAVGGMPVFNTPDGRWRRGDAWEHDGEIIIFTSDDPTWGMATAIATAPVGGTSQLQGIVAGDVNHATSAATTAVQTELLDGTLDRPVSQPQRTRTVIDTTIPNQ